jgi:hydroxymethylpyrimidine pyrophosphatase-like HAD family hydrolase
VALGVDLDRTILREGRRIAPAAHTALREAHRMGLRTILVSGRLRPRLVELARELEDFDALVAENGAVVQSPMGASARIFGRRTASNVLRRLEAVPGLEVERGEVIVSAGLPEGRTLRTAVAGLPVGLVRNVDRWMVLPDGVNKASGMEAALRGLGLAGRPFAAIGDAENDLDLLRAASLSGAVANAEPAVLASVDFVCKRSFAGGVLEFVRGPVADRFHPTPR